MDDTAVVRGFESVGDLKSQVERLFNGNPAALKPIRQRLAFHELQHEESRVAGLFQAVDSGNIRMIESGEQLRFPLESRRTIGVTGESSRQEFDGDVSSELRVRRLINLSHTTCPEVARDL